MRTQSEKWFETFCKNQEIVCNRIEEEETNTPDYELRINDKAIIVEVKEFTRNDEEKKSDKALNDNGAGLALSNTPGNRVRKKISRSSAQIKARTQEVNPSILVLCDIQYGCGQITGHTDPYNIRVGMYGLEQIHLSVPKDKQVSPYSKGMSYGPKKKMTEDQNTSISAIGVLSTPNENEIKLSIYHNIHAAIPLDASALSKYDITQYHLVGKEPNTTAKWEIFNV